MYFPILFMLLGLIFRGVAFEFRLKAHKSRFLWDHVVLLGLARRDLRTGLSCSGSSCKASRSRPTSSSVPACTTGSRPFPLAVGVGLVFGYLLLGRDVARDEDGRRRSRSGRVKWARLALFGVIAFIAMVSIWTPLSDPRIAARWFGWPNLALPRAAADRRPRLIALWLWRSLGTGRDARAVLRRPSGCSRCASSGSASACCPTSCRRRSACGTRRLAPQSQAFLLIGTLFLLPIIMMYTGWSY